MRLGTSALHLLPASRVLCMCCPTDIFKNLCQHAQAGMNGQGFPHSTGFHAQSVGLRSVWASDLTLART